VGRRGEPLLHDRKQRLAAREIFRFLALGKKRGGLVDRGSAMIGGLVHVASSSTVNRVPDAIRRRRHFQLVVADGIRDGVDDGGRGADRAGLAAALDAERVARTQRRGVLYLERRQIV